MILQAVELYLRDALHEEAMALYGMIVTIYKKEHNYMGMIGYVC